LPIMEKGRPFMGEKKESRIKNQEFS